MPVFPVEKLRTVAFDVFRAAGADPEPAGVVSEHLIAANLAGHDSHGVLRIPSYVRSIKSGAVAPNARPEIVRETQASALIDAHRTFGQVSALFATDLAIAKARAQGVAIAGTIHGNHIGRVGHYPAHAAAQGVVLLATTGSLGRSAAPFGGRAGALGTNPIAFGFPTLPESGRPDFLLDFATTTIAGGKVMVARAKHEPVPSNSLLDKNGNPTADPNAYFDGGILLPFGAHKGYALSVLTVLLSNVLLRTEGEVGRGGGAFFLAIDAGIFGDASAVAAEAARVFGRLKEVPPAPGFDEVLVPGEPEARAAAYRREAGIPVADDTWHEIVATAAELGLVL